MSICLILSAAATRLTGPVSNKELATKAKPGSKVTSAFEFRRHLPPPGGPKFTQPVIGKARIESHDRQYGAAQSIETGRWLLDKLIKKLPFFTWNQWVFSRKLDPYARNCVDIYIWHTHAGCYEISRILNYCYVKEF